MPDQSNLGTPLQIGNVTLPNRVFLAPMSGVTDQPFRLRAHRAGAGLTVSEMVASGELTRGRAESERRIRLSGIPVQSVQIVGREAGAMAEAARMAEVAGASLIDINMGCPAKKVTGGACGSALMRDPDHALRLIEAVVSAVSVPVTLKMRLGWDENTPNAPEIARLAENAGIRMITIHGRTRCQFYKGRADWRAIRTVREAITVPLVANGDVETVDDAREIIAQSGADAVMIGRGHYGRPWLAGSIAQASQARFAPPDSIVEESISNYISMHYEEMLMLYGRSSGVRHARKHLGWYLERHAPRTPSALRQAIMTDTDPESVARLLGEAFANNNTCAMERAA